MIQNGELLCEWACQQSHRPAYLQIMAELQNAASVGRRDQRLDHPVQNRMRLIAPHHQPRYPESSVNTAPLMPGEIEYDKQIPGEKWRFNRI